MPASNLVSSLSIVPWSTMRYSPVSGLINSTFARALKELMIISLSLLRSAAGEVGARSIVFTS